MQHVNLSGKGNWTMVGFKDRWLIHLLLDGYEVLEELPKKLDLSEIHLGFY